MPVSSSARRIARSFRRPVPVTISLDGKVLEAVPGESLAAALLVAGRTAFKCSVGLRESRGPFCMMGVCQECVVEVDGTRREACLVAVQAGLVVRTGPASDG